MLRRPTVVTVAIALVVTLTACTESARIPDADPSSEVAPLFASDDEALAAATAAYVEYLAVSSQLTSSPEADKDPLRPLTTPGYFTELTNAIEELHARGQQTTGGTILQSARLQQFFEDPAGSVTVIIYACIDVSAVRVLDTSGADVTPVDRADLVNLEVELVSGDDSQSSLLVAQSEGWAGGDLCEG